MMKKKTRKEPIRGEGSDVRMQIDDGLREDSAKSKEWLNIMNLKEGLAVNPEIEVAENREMEGEVCTLNSIRNSKTPLLQLSIDHVSDEIDYWNLGVVAYVIGTNPFLGKPIKPDSATHLKEKLQYARFFEEVATDGDFPNMIEFLNEKGVLFSQKVVFEWKHITCKGYEKELDETQQKVHQGGYQDENLKELELQTLKEFQKIGDENSSYFHRSLRMRRYRKSIIAIKNKNGDWCNSPDHISAAFMEYYKELLGSDQGARIPIRKEIV
uniref:Uncharacterized protein n=1 Tax=Chenopodium quinoa TaxID=63459 RepID=A0A803M2P3_CHEQI